MIPTMEPIRPARFNRLPRCVSCKHTGQFCGAYPPGSGGMASGFTRTMYRVECNCGVCGPWCFNIEDAWLRWDRMTP